MRELDEIVKDTEPWFTLAAKERKGAEQDEIKQIFYQDYSRIPRSIKYPELAFLAFLRIGQVRDAQQIQELIPKKFKFSQEKEYLNEVTPDGFEALVEKYVSRMNNRRQEYDTTEETKHLVQDFQYIQQFTDSKPDLELHKYVLSTLVTVHEERSSINKKRPLGRPKYENTSVNKAVIYYVSYLYQNITPSSDGVTSLELVKMHKDTEYKDILQSVYGSVVTLQLKDSKEAINKIRGITGILPQLEGEEVEPDIYTTSMKRIKFPYNVDPIKR